MNSNRNHARWFVALVALVLAVPIATGTPWHEVLRNLLVKGKLFVGTGTPGVTQTQGSIYASGTLEVDGAATLDGAVTFNTTTTHTGHIDIDGVAELTNSNNSGVLSWIATGSGMGVNTITSPALTLSDANYAVWLEPTAGVSHARIVAGSKTQSSFQVSTPEDVSADVSMRFVIIPY